ncbi:unnamed protein product [Alopecurus aequalis]
MPEFKPVVTAIFVMALLATASSETSTAEIHDRDTSRVTEVQVQSTRVLTEVLDYDYGAANSKHDPHRRPGNGH